MAYWELTDAKGEACVMLSTGNFGSCVTGNAGAVGGLAARPEGNDGAECCSIAAGDRNGTGIVEGCDIAAGGPRLLHEMASLLDHAGCWQNVLRVLGARGDPCQKGAPGSLGLSNGPACLNWI